MNKHILLLLAALAICLAVACGGDDSSSSATPSSTPTAIPTASGPTPYVPTPSPVPITHTIKVFAASSLTASFTEIAKGYEAEFPGIGVDLNFGGSQDLRTQIVNGAEADIFASADKAQMDELASVGLVGGLRQVFAHNRLAIIVPKRNEANIQTPKDLAKSGLKIVLGGETVPVGKYARQFLDAASADPSYGAGYKAAVLANVVSEATNVKEVVSAVQLDEADAGIVYVTDVTGDVSDDVTKIDIPDALNQIADYPISLTLTGLADDYAQAFIDYVLGENGQATLTSFGFTGFGS